MYDEAARGAPAEGLWPIQQDSEYQNAQHNSDSEYAPQESEYQNVQLFLNSEPEPQQSFEAHDEEASTADDAEPGEQADADADFEQQHQSSHTSTVYDPVAALLLALQEDDDEPQFVDGNAAEAVNAYADPVTLVDDQEDDM